MKRNKKRSARKGPGLKEQTGESLEFPTILRFFAWKARTEEGRARIMALDLMDREAQRPHYEMLDQWFVYLDDYGPLSFPEIPSSAMFQRQPLLDPFDIVELKLIRDFLLFLRRLFNQEQLDFARPGLERDADLEALTSRLESIFKPDGSWREDVSPLYGQLIRRFERTESNLNQMLNGLMRGNSDYLNEQIVFERNYRKVLAVKQNFRGKVRGILQDYSASGSTVYIEPEQTVSLQNDLTQIQAEIKEELWRIRCQLTEAIILRADLAEKTAPAIARMDMMQALALAAREARCVSVCPNSDRQLHLINARHPFLDEAFAPFRLAILDQDDNNRMIPFSLRLDDELLGLVISGANTGGKTVTLKTTGLMAWMANSGLPIPLDEGSCVPFYKIIVADIGDHQSLSHNLSTYASHLAGMKEIFEEEGHDTLALLDELGSGTDPQEGNALAQAMIEEMMDRRFHLLTTTHQQILCTLALNHAHLDNGSMVFDPKQLKPTFRFTQGVPGRSHALDTAANSGVPVSILERARQLIDEDQVDIQAAIRKLQEQHKSLRKQEQKMRREELRFYRQTKDVRHEGEELKRVKDSLKEDARKRLGRTIEKAEKELRGLLSEIKSQKQRKTAVVKFAETRKELLTPLGEPEKLPEVTVEPSGVESKDWKPGDRVYLKNWLKEAVLQAVDRKKARVDFQGKTISLTVDDLIHLKPEKESGKSGGRVMEHLEDDGDEALSVELRLLGWRVDDALLEVDQTIDRAMRKGIPFLKIIHGHGSGKLKNAVRDFLRTHVARAGFDVDIDLKNDGVTEIRFQV